MRDKVTQILMDSIIKTALEEGSLPWEQPWKHMFPFNWYTMSSYRGINRWILETGEYLTANQLREYNKKNGTDYKFAKGIKWMPVLFVRNHEKVVTYDELPEPVAQAFEEKKARGELPGTGAIWIAFSGKYSYAYKVPNTFLRVQRVRVFHRVAERHHFVNSKGECLPSRIESGEMIITKEKPETIAKSYLQREGIPLVHRDIARAYYSPSRDFINIPPRDNFKSTEHLYSTLFHEMGHSSGAVNRLNRPGVADINTRDREKYSKEEVVAELCASLLCAEAGLMNYTPDQSKEFTNRASYIQGYLQFLQDAENDLVYICSDAEKACDFIMSACDPEVDKNA